jgi:monoamine oxidase
MEKVIIVGAGIAGLNTAYQILKKKNYSVLIIEKEKELGGRMYTKKVEIDKKSFSLEGGAGVLRDDDETTIELAHELNIPLKFWKSDTAVVYHDGKKSEILNYDYVKATNELCKKSENDESFIEILEKNKTLPEKEKIGVLIGTTYSELFNANSKDVCEYNDWFEFLYSGDSNTHQFGKPKAWSDLVDKLEQEILKQGGQILKNTSVIEIKNKSVKTNRNQIFNYDKLILTCPYHCFDKIKTPTSLKAWRNFLDKYHEEVDYLRIFSFFEEPLEITKKIATNLSIRRVIPITNQMIMSVYTDGPDAKYIHKMCKDEDKLSKYIREELSTLLERDIPKIKKNWCFFWYKGISYWKPSNYSVEEMVEMIRHPVENIYVCGDTYSRHPGWVDGAMESCEFIIDSL